MWKLIAGTTDGASAMQGNVKGVLQLLENEAGLFIKTHCASHKVLLVAKDSFSQNVYTEVDSVLKELF